MTGLIRAGLSAASLALLASLAAGAELSVETSAAGRSPGQWRSSADLAARRLQSLVSAASRGAALPARITLELGGRPLAYSGRRAPGPITLVFDTAGSRVFPDSYRQLLQDVFNTAEPILNTTLGPASRQGAVRVKNYDVDISDRQAVAGGYYVDNAPEGPEIRFPVYQSSAAVAVNFIHTLALAYRGANPFPTEAWNEGAARAAVMQVVRTPGALPASIDLASAEAALASLYDRGEVYDWLNQPALSGPTFIAPNLLSQPLPVGGSTGGIFLIRHQMAGTALSKAIAERPLFLARLAAAHDAAPALDESGLLMLAQTALDQASGTSPGTIEGLTMTPWARRQHILNPNLTGGLKTLIEPQALEAAPGSSDFGVFALALHAFRVDPSGSETLLSGQSSPLFLRPDGERFFTSAQDDVASVSGGFGSVVPNFPADAFAGQPYAVQAVMPFGGQAAQAILPAGGYSDGQNFDPATFYGTTRGFVIPSGARLEATVAYPGGARTGVVQNGAFRLQISDIGYLRAGPVEVTVHLVDGPARTVALSRRVNKTPGALALNLEPDSAQTSQSLTLEPRLSLIGLALEPQRDGLTTLLPTVSPGEMLAAIYDPFLGRYRAFPIEGRLQRGIGAFVRLPRSVTVIAPGRRTPGEWVAVHLQPGWNLLANPFPVELPLSAVRVTSAAESVSPYNDAQGVLVGLLAFGFTPSAVNPDEGQLVEATTIPAGGAVFVRALRAEGAVALMQQPGPGSLMTLPQMGRREMFAPTSRAGSGSFLWESKARLLHWGQPVAEARFGQAMRATGREDALFDSALPPAVAGPQMALIGSSALYRDMRSWGTAETWTIRLIGLRPGERYRLEFEPLAGRRDFTVSGIGPSLRVEERGRIDFWADSSEATLTVRAGGR